jgi:hypothetical protein
MNRDGGGIKDVLISYVDIHFRLPSIYAFYIYIYKTTRVKDTSISFIFAFSVHLFMRFIICLIFRLTSTPLAKQLKG